MELFGILPDGTKVYKYTLSNKNGMSVSAINYGGIITNVFVPDRDGNIEDVVLGYDTLEGYMADTHYMGAIIGRCANRIAGGSFELDGKTYTLYHNDGDNSHHGGKNGFNTKWWQIEEIVLDLPGGESAAALRLTYTSPDGEEGYPGNLQTEVIYALTETNELMIFYRATTDKPTIVNLTNHTYFNLSGAQQATVENSCLSVQAKTYLPLNSRQVPDGRRIAVTDDPAFNFWNYGSDQAFGGRVLSEFLAQSHEQIALAGGLDHTFELEPNASIVLSDAATDARRILFIYTMEPALHVYSGNYLNGDVPGKGGVRYQPHSGIAFEAQKHPDAIHHADFPSVVLRPGEVYQTGTFFRFRP